MSLTLYHFPASPNAVKVLATLHHLGLDFEEKIVDITRGESHLPEYTRLNPNGVIPTLVDDDFVLWESNAIMIYLAEKSSSDLMPQDVRDRADVNRWLSWQLAHWSPAVGGLTFERIAPHFIDGYRTDEVASEKALASLERYAPVLNDHLNGRDYLVGSQLTLADLAVASQMVHWRMADLPLQSYDHILAWYETVEQLESWRKALPKMSATS